MRVLKAVSFASLFLGTTVSIAQAQGYSPGTAATASRTRPGVNYTTDDQSSATIRHKLASLIIPNTEFHATTLSDAIEYLRQEARRVDTDPDPDARGVNIFLKLPPTASRPAALPTETGISPANTSPSATTRITLNLSHLPLLEILKYVAVEAGLKVRIEPYAVSLVPPTEDTDPMVTAVFHVPPTMIPNRTSDFGKTALDDPATAVH